MSRGPFQQPSFPSCRRVRGCLIALSATLLAAFGCNPIPTRVESAQMLAEHAAYAAALQRYTRRVELYDGFDTVAKGWATWRAPPLRSALAEASARAYQLGEEAARAMLRDERRAARRVREFHLALYTPEEGWNDLETAGTLWRSYLELPGGERLEAVQTIHLPKDDRSRVEFPYVTPWTREYALFYPLLDTDEPHEHLTLVLTGPLGTLRFAF